MVGKQNHQDLDCIFEDSMTTENTTAWTLRQIKVHVTMERIGSADKGIIYVRFIHSRA